MSVVKKKITLTQADLDAIDEALDYHIESLLEKLEEHERSESRFDASDTWLQKREHLWWLLCKARHAQNRIVRRIEGKPGRYSKSLKQLLSLRAQDFSNEYETLVDATKRLSGFGLFEATTRLYDKHVEGVIDGFRYDGLLYLRTIDVMRYAAYLEANM